MNNLALNIDCPTDIATLGEHILAPKTQEIDEAGYYPAHELKILANAGIYRHLLSEHKGNGLINAIDDMMQIGKICGSTAFCMWCQNTLLWYVVNSQNTNLKTKYATDIANGLRNGGTGLSNPMKSYAGIENLALRGKRTKGGYLVSGILPWVSNLDDSHYFGSIFQTHDGQRIMALFDCGQDGISLVQNAHFIGLEGTATYSVMLKNVVVANNDAIIADKADDFVPTIRTGFVLLQLGMILGVSQSLIDMIINDRATRQGYGGLPYEAEPLLERSNKIQENIKQLAKSYDDTSIGQFKAVLKTRLDGAYLALDAAQSATIQMGSRGYLQHSELFRLQREAHFTAILTPSIKHITKILQAT